ncbi:MAG TPA: LLM class flavin-dependent oxidoreductase [Chloroflexota bacterium]|nr:LLM class flavin-dependent oxidoreductase [Chloroflexota bacterium]
MRFGILSLLSYVPELDGSPAEVLGRVLDDAAYAEQLGFDSYWLTEHHFENFGGLLSAPTVVLGSLAQRTQRLRLGIAVSLLPLHHPLRLAEEWATVDVLSGGRLELGIGKGFSAWEYTHFGVRFEDASERFDEALDIMLAAWRPGRFDYVGQNYTVHDLQVLPKPVQQPHPPLWASAVRTRDSYVWAGQRGFNLMTAPFLIDFATLREHMDLYYRTLAEAGHAAAGKEVLANLQVCVAPTREEAIAAAAPAFGRANAVRAAAAHRDPNATGARPKRSLDGLHSSTVEALARDARMLVGSPDDCVRILETLQDEIGITHFIGTFHFGGLPRDTVRRSLELFSREVAPRVCQRGQPGRLAAAPR